MNMGTKTVTILLLFIITLGGFLRFFNLGDKLLGVTADEIQQGYTAYSLYQTGMDEWGDKWPVFPRGFGDYKPPVYSYLTIPFVALFGLEIWAVRLPSAILGTLTIAVIFFLAQELFKNYKISLLSALILSVSYWHMAFSRIAWESNAGSFFFLLGFLFFLKGLKKNNLLFFSALFFGVSIFAYFSFKLLAVLFIAGLVFLFYKDFTRINKSKLAAVSVIFLFFVGLSLIGDIFYGGARRTADAAIFNPENLEQLRNIQVADPLPQPFGRIINNKPVYLFGQFFQNYFGYFSTTFLVSPNRSDATLFNLTGTWLISFWEFLLVLIGVFLFIKNPTREAKVLGLLALLSPVPAALTREYMHTQRTEIILFLVPVVAAYSALHAYQFLGKWKLKVLNGVFFGLLVTGSLVQRIDFYFYHQFNPNMGGLKYGYQEMIDFTESQKSSYNKIVFTKSYSMPQIFVAFYSKMDPKEFQKYSATWKHFETDGLRYVDMVDMNMGKYEFRGIDWDKDKKLQNALIVVGEKEIPPEPINKFIVKAPNGKVIFRAIDSNNVD